MLYLNLLNQILGSLLMNFTRKFFQAIADTVAIITTMWLFFIVVMVGIFIVFYFTGYVLNPFLFVGLLFIYVLFASSEKYQGIGCLVAIIFTVLMLTVGRVPTTEEQEAKKQEEKIAQANEEYQKKQEKIKYKAKLSSFRDSEGNEFIREEKETDTPEQRYRLKDKQQVSMTFSIFLKGSENESKYPLEKDLDLERFFIETNDVYFNMSALTDTSYDEKTGELTGSSVINFTDHATVIEGDFKIQLVSRDNHLEGIRSYRTYYNIEYEDAYPEEEKVTLESSAPVEQAIKPSKTYKHEPEDVVITEGNRDDWEHILDDWELEEAEWDDAYYE